MTQTPELAKALSHLPAMRFGVLLENEQKNPYEPRVTAYFDILGWKVASSDSTQRTRAEMAAVFTQLFGAMFTEEYATRYEGLIGERGCSEKVYESLRHVRVTTFSDNVVISAPPNKTADMLNHLSQICRWLIQCGFLFRGAITFGELMHRNGAVMGPALNEAATHDISGAPPGIECTDSFLQLVKDAELPKDRVFIIDDVHGRSILNLFPLPNINATDLTPHSPDEHVSCKSSRIDSDIGISSLCRLIGDNHGAPSG